MKIYIELYQNLVMLYRNVLMGILGIPRSISNIIGDLRVRSSTQICPFLVSVLKLNILSNLLRMKYIEVQFLMP